MVLSRSGSVLAHKRKSTSLVLCTSQSSSTTTMYLENIFHWRRPDDCRRINGVMPMRDRGQMKDRIILDRSIETGVVAERSLRSHFARLDKTFQNEISISGNLHIDGFAFHQVHRFFAQKSSKQNFIEPIG